MLCTFWRLRCAYLNSLRLGVASPVAAMASAGACDVDDWGSVGGGSSTFMGSAMASCGRA